MCLDTVTCECTGKPPEEVTAWQAVVSIMLLSLALCRAGQAILGYSYLIYMHCQMHQSRCGPVTTM